MKFTDKIKEMFGIDPKWKFKGDKLLNICADRYEQFCCEKPLTQQQRISLEKSISALWSYWENNDMNYVRQNLNNLPPFLRVCVAAEKKEVLADVLKEYPQDIHLTRSDNGQTPLHCLCSYHSALFGIRNLIKAGIDINAQDNNGWTPLMCCTARKARTMYLYEEQTSDFKELMEYSPDLTIRNNNGKTALDVCNNSNIQQIIIEGMAQQNALKQVERLNGKMDVETLCILNQLMRYMSSTRIENNELKREVAARFKQLRSRSKTD